MKKKYSSITCRYILPVVASSIKIISLFSFSYNWLFVVCKKSVMFSAQEGRRKGDRVPFFLLAMGGGRSRTK